jgi:hypothetical protein
MPFKKTVTIVEENNQVFPIQHVNDISEEEFKQIWFSPDEYDEIKASYRANVCMMEAGEALDLDHFTSRGLEYRTQEGAWARHENKRDGCNAVLDEQYRQWVEFADLEFNEEEIAQAFMVHSKRCALAATVKGLEDEMEAIHIYKSCATGMIGNPFLKLQGTDVQTPLLSVHGIQCLSRAA